MEVVLRMAVLLLILAEKSTKDIVGRLGILTQFGNAWYGGSRGLDMSHSLVPRAGFDLMLDKCWPHPHLNYVVCS